jgi:adenylate cyclase
MGIVSSGRTPTSRRMSEFEFHIGDIINDNDIFGDGVNIAARLEGIAEPGGICLSDDAYRQIRGKVEVPFDDVATNPL